MEVLSLITGILGLIAGLLLGAIFGVIVDLLFRQPILRNILRVRRWYYRRLRRTDPFAGKPMQLKLGLLDTTWVSLHGTGEVPLESSLLRTELDDAYVQLPPELEALRDEMRKTLAQREADGRSDVWNGERFALREIRPTRHGAIERMGVWFNFQLTDYAAFLGLTCQLDELGLVRDALGNPCSIRSKYYEKFDPEVPNPYLTHSFGINLVLLTRRDHKVILVQRNAFVAISKKKFSISVNEGMQYPLDLDEHGKPSFINTAVRGLWEELGLDLKELGVSPDRIEFLNFGAFPTTNEFGLLGCIELPVTSVEVEQAYFQRAKDRGLETRHQLYAVDFLPDQLLTFVNSHRPWAPHGIATLYYTMVRKWGYWETRQAIIEQPLETTILEE